MAVKVQLKNNGSTGTTSKPTASSQLHGEIFVDTVNGELNFVNQNKDGWHTLSADSSSTFSTEITATNGIGNNSNTLYFKDNAMVYTSDPKLTVKNNSTNANGTATLELYAMDSVLSWSNQNEYTSWRIKKNNAAGSGSSSYNGRLEFAIVNLHYGDYVQTEYTRAWITTTGNMYTSGSYSNSSRELKESISSLSEELAVETVMSLEPVHYKYKQDPEENHIGFIAEDTSELLTDKEKRAIPALDVIATVTKVVQKQDREIKELKKEIEDLKNLILNSGVN